MIGTCQDENLIEEIFGSVSEFARLVELRGNNFEYKDIFVTYDEEKDIHTFWDYPPNLKLDKMREIL